MLYVLKVIKKGVYEMTITIIEDKKITSFEGDFAEIINDKLYYMNGSFDNFIKITPHTKHIFIDGVDVLSYYKKSEIKSESASKMTLEEFNKLYVGKLIHCKTKKLANEFLELADSLGFTWFDGNKLTSFNEWDVYKDKTCYTIYLDEYILFDNVDNEELSVVEFKGVRK
jgi:hypothetical protein